MSERTVFLKVVAARRQHVNVVNMASVLSRRMDKHETQPSSSRTNKIGCETYSASISTTCLSVNNGQDGASPASRKQISHISETEIS